LPPAGGLKSKGEAAATDACPKKNLNTTIRWKGGPREQVVESQKRKPREGEKTAAAHPGGAAQGKKNTKKVAKRLKKGARHGGEGRVSSGGGENGLDFGGTSLANSWPKRRTTREREMSKGGKIRRGKPWPAGEGDNSKPAEKNQRTYALTNTRRNQTSKRKVHNVRGPTTYKP